MGAAIKLGSGCTISLIQTLTSSDKVTKPEMLNNRLVLSGAEYYLMILQIRVK